jgi:hypothetical protein
MDYVNDIVFSNNVVAGITERTYFYAENTLDKRGGVLVCGMYGWETCSNTQLTNNIVAGAYYAGFMSPGIECGSDD